MKNLNLAAIFNGPVNGLVKSVDCKQVKPGFDDGVTTFDAVDAMVNNYPKLIAFIESLAANDQRLNNRATCFLSMLDAPGKMFNEPVKAVAAAPVQSGTLNSDMTATPLVNENGAPFWHGDIRIESECCIGLTKRETFCLQMGVAETGDPELDAIITKGNRQKTAALAMQSMLSNYHLYDMINDTATQHLAVDAVTIAEALALELN